MLNLQWYYPDQKKIETTARTGVRAYDLSSMHAL